MNISDFIDVYYMPVVAAICFGVGYVIKHWLPTDNKWIPTVGAVLGAVLGCLALHEVTVEAVAKGMISGLAATGLYELYSEHKEAHDMEAIFDELDTLDIEVEPDTGEFDVEPEAEG